MTSTDRLPSLVREPVLLLQVPPTGLFRSCPQYEFQQLHQVLSFVFEQRILHPSELERRKQQQLHPSNWGGGSSSTSGTRTFVHLKIQRPSTATLVAMKGCNRSIDASHMSIQARSLRERAATVMTLVLSRSSVLPAPRDFVSIGTSGCFALMYFLKLQRCL